MAINFVDGKYVNPETGRVTLDPTMYKDWQIAEEAEKTLPSVDFFREKLGLLPEEIIPYHNTPLGKIRSEEILHHSKSLGRRNDSRLRICLGKIKNIGTVVRFHVLDYQIVRLSVTQSILNIIQPLMGKILIYSIHNSDLIVHNGV